MAEALTTQLRDTRGKHHARRTRRAGSIPAVLYGHGKENLALSVVAEELDTAVRHGVRVVNLSGAVQEQAFIRQLQWDTWGTHVLHADFTRISEHEKVEVQVSVELRGEAPGIKEGGVVEHLIHELDIECEVLAIPEHLTVNVNHLGLNGEIRVRDLVLPPTVVVQGDLERLVVQCKVPEEAPEEAAPGGVEPELIGRKAGEGEEEGE